jgi:hypothetical protein
MSMRFNPDVPSKVIAFPFGKLLPNAAHSVETRFSSSHRAPSTARVPVARR